MPLSTCHYNTNYEKIYETSVKYFHVNDNDPTGIPNAFVVSDNEGRQFLPGFE